MKRTVLVAVLLGLAILAASGGSTVTRTVLVRVEADPNPWVESHLESKLIEQLTRSRHLRAASGRDLDHYPPLPAALHDVDSLINWGIEAGGRYVLLVRIDDQRLERRKTFAIPLLFHKWKTIGVVEGELRLVDIERGILLTAEPFVIEREAKRQFQLAIDDDQTDPSLRVSAVEKLRFFDQLEEDASRYLMERISQYIRG